MEIVAVEAAVVGTAHIHRCLPHHLFHLQVIPSFNKYMCDFTYRMLEYAFNVFTGEGARSP